MSTIKIIGVGLILSLLSTTAYAGTKHYYYTDAQGTVLAKADAQGNIIATYDYAPYGTQVLGTPPSGPAGYTGHVNDPDTGLVYMQARYYDPSTGRFLSVDPVQPIAGDSFTFNRFVYAQGNPANVMDPDGRYGRGKGFTDRQWKKFQRAQEKKAKRLRSKAIKIMTASESGKGLGRVQREFERTFGKGSATYENMGRVAGSLAEMASALEDDGTNGFEATGFDATTFAEKTGFDADALAAAPIGGKFMYVNLGHPSYNTSSILGWAIGHESAHDFGMVHGIVNGVTAYKYGNDAQRDAFKRLPSVDPAAALQNPDTLMDYVR